MLMLAAIYHFVRLDNTIYSRYAPEAQLGTCLNSKAAPVKTATDKVRWYNVERGCVHASKRYLSTDLKAKFAPQHHQSIAHIHCSRLN